MFNRDSRYAKVPIKSFTDATGRVISHVARRIVPDAIQPVAQIKVQAGDRLDLISHRVYGDPGLFWRIADANPDPEPDALADEARHKLAITQIAPE
jgi:nucleoid-associated protein YgaU